MIRRFIDIVVMAAILIVVVLAILNRDSFTSMREPIAKAEKRTEVVKSENNGSENIDENADTEGVTNTDETEISA
jgi:hypothetical protein